MAIYLYDGDDPLIRVAVINLPAIGKFPGKAGVNVIYKSGWRRPPWGGFNPPQDQGMTLAEKRVDLSACGFIPWQDLPPEIDPWATASAVVDSLEQKNFAVSVADLLKTADEPIDAVG